ncbi:MAG TPA: sodium-independent anion transporter [Flavobacteriaceae bacterium]|jgi:SulP family sulfate permease|nr:sodium-independent anion transporter [Flavobacteriaceae bacterium]HBS13028.1 sodium-independent anion transporter [Flavobacteriaceae bacterium]
MTLKKIFPILEWFSTYKKDWLKGDLGAGLTVGVMLIPQGMAYASIAGMPPVYGLYASIVPIIIYAILGTSRQLAVGPVAMVSLLTATAIGSFGDLSVEQYVMYAILLAFLVGAIQFVLGLFRLGFLVNFLSHPVVSGFTSAAALIIGLSQLKSLLGINIPRSHHINEILMNAFHQFDEINWISFAIGVVGIGVILLVKKLNKSLPSQLFAVIFGILAVTLLGLNSGENTVKIVGDIPSSLPGFMIPNLDLNLMNSLLPMAITISLVSFMESIAVAKAIQSKHRDYKVLPNQELIGLGLANVVGSFFQSFPTTGGFSRTAVNDQAGAKTGLSAIISAALIIITLLFLTPLFYNLPKAILASVIMVAVFGLIDYKEAIHLWKSDRTDFFLLVITFLATLTIGIEKGIGLGVILSLAIVILKTTRPHVAVLANIHGTHFYRNISRFEDDLIIKDDVLIIRFDAQLYFANTTFFKDKLEELVTKKGEKLKLIIIDGKSMNSLDSSGVHALLDVINTYQAKGLKIAFSGMKGPVRDAMRKGGVIDKISFDHCFMSLQEAVDCYEDMCNDTPKEKKFNKFIEQSN